MKDELKAKFSEAVKLHQNGDLSSAKTIFLELSKQDPQSAVIFSQLGHVLWDMRFLNEAASAFEHAVELAPKLEAVSKGLFHCLWEMGQRDKALEEIKRFQSISDSKDYREIIREIIEKCSD